MANPIIKFGSEQRQVCLRRAAYLKFDPSSNGECVETKSVTIRSARLCIPQPFSQLCVDLPEDTAERLYEAYQKLMSGQVCTSVKFEENLATDLRCFGYSRFH